MVRMSERLSGVSEIIPGVSESVIDASVTKMRTVCPLTFGFVQNDSISGGAKKVKGGETAQGARTVRPSLSVLLKNVVVSEWLRV